MSNRTRCALLSPFLFVALLTTAGCGSKSNVVKVEGVVTLDGQPLSGATVTYVPVENGRAASGRTDVDGRFYLTTFRTDDGAMAGNYKVVVVVDETDEKSVGRDPKTFDNEEKAANYKKHMTMGKKPPEKKKSPKVPPIYSDVKQTPLKETVPPTGKVELALRTGAR